MKRWLVTLAVFVLCLAPLHADLTFTQTMTFEGGPMAEMMKDKPVVMLTRVKGTKMRTDTDGMGVKMTMLGDLTAKQITMLNHQDKTAQVLSTTAPLAAPDMPKLDIDVTFRPTGESRAIDGVPCAEHRFRIVLTLAEMSGGQMPKEQAEMLKDVRVVMDGAMWIAKGGPGADEYIAFQKAAAKADMAAMIASILSGGQAGRGGLDKLIAAMSEAPGMPYLTEIAMDIEGPGPMVEIMKKQMAGMKIVQRTSGITTEAIADDMFKVPADYTVKK